MITLEIVKSHPEVLNALARACDIEIFVPDNEDPGFTIESGVPYHVIARDASGGIFAQCGQHDPKPILHVTSEGQAGVIGHHLPEAIQIVSALPYWRDLLHFSGNGHLEEMRRAAPLLEQSIHEDEPEIDTIRNLIFVTLQLERLEDAISRLHDTVSTLSKKYQPVSKDGRHFESLFGRFVVTDNPMWKDKI
jgi:hypothetical protein